MNLLRRLNQLASDVLFGGALLGIVWLAEFLVGAYGDKRPGRYGR